MDFLNKFDRQKLQKITLLVIAALTLIALVLLLVIIIASVEGGSPNNNINDPAETFEEPTIEPTEDLIFTTASVTDAQLSRGSLLLVNSNHKYDIPADLNLVNCYDYRQQNKGEASESYNLIDRSPRLEANAMEHAHNMLMDLGNATGNHSIMISSAFRTYEDQAGKEIAQGHSDHHTGLLLSLTVYGGANPYLSHESNEALSNWLNDNAHKYGFVVRYPENKVESTGVSDYTNAFRYVGVAHSTYMKEHDLSLEEYVAYLKENTSPDKCLKLTAADGNNYAIYYVSCASGSEIKVPEQTANPNGSTSNPYTVSGTNEGGVIITVTLN
jgi:D-alanyl-D-alanine carboxypeptidase